MADIKLYVKGQIWTGWEEATVTHAIDSICGQVTLKLTQEPGRVPILRAGDECRLDLDGETVIAGILDEVSSNVDADKMEFRVEARDKTALLLKGAVLNDPAEWKNQNAQQIAAAICKPFGIVVRVEAEGLTPFEKFTCHPGAAAAREIARICGHKALYAVSDGNANLILSNALAAQDSGGVIRFDDKTGNAFQARYMNSHRERHSSYVIKNQDNGDDWGTAAHTDVHAAVTDAAIVHYCPKVTLPDEPGDISAMKRLAAQQAAIAVGRSELLTYSLSGWQTPKGKIWRVNRKVPVRDIVHNIDREMLIGRVVLTVKKDEAPATRLTVVDLDAWALIAVPEKKDKGGW